MKKMKLKEVKFEDFFNGPPPAFAVSQAKRKPGPKKAATEGEFFRKQEKLERKMKKEEKMREKAEKKERKKEGKCSILKYFRKRKLGLIFKLLIVYVYLENPH